MSSYQNYLTYIVRELHVLPGFIIGGHNINNVRWHSLNTKHRQKTTKAPTEGSEGKQEERTKHQLQEDRMHGC